MAQWVFFTYFYFFSDDSSLFFVYLICLHKPGCLIYFSEINLLNHDFH